jgi:hypothetical protein
MVEFHAQVFHDSNYSLTIKAPHSCLALGNHLLNQSLELLAPKGTPQLQK